ncbi:uncharacterized protein [Ptychodera flava]|uniref:uncharacterized protein isoform X2 n=1 Tax=Ptychodera flava TaxID=63121 RepID=UPI003969E915
MLDSSIWLRIIASVLTPTETGNHNPDRAMDTPVSQSPILLLLYAVATVTGLTIVLISIAVCAKKLCKKFRPQSTLTSESSTDPERTYSDLPPSYSNCVDISAILEGDCRSHQGAADDEVDVGVPDCPPPTYDSVLKKSLHHVPGINAGDQIRENEHSNSFIIGNDNSAAPQGTLSQSPSCAATRANHITGVEVIVE